MKKITYSFVILMVLSVSCFAQLDVSVYNKYVPTAQKQYTAIPWATYSHHDYFLDARYNFDQDKTSAIFVGKSFGPLTVAIGPMFGDYNGVSAEMYYAVSSEKEFMIFMYQYSKGTSESFNFTYQWVELLHEIYSGIQVGLGEQAYSDPSFASVEAGPLVKITSGKFYIKPWVTYDFNGKFTKFFLGIGIVL